jgi:general secretion pathway protein B
MSYILQALKRAAQERESGVVAVRRAPPPATGPARRSWWAWGAVAVLVLNGIVLLVVLGPSLRGRPASAPGDDSRVASSRVVSSPAPDRSRDDAAGTVSGTTVVSPPAKVTEAAPRAADRAAREQVRQRMAKPADTTARPNGEVTRTTPATPSGDVTRAAPATPRGEVGRAAPAAAGGERKSTAPTAPPGEKAAGRGAEPGPAPAAPSARASREARAQSPATVADATGRDSRKEPAAPPAQGKAPSQEPRSSVRDTPAPAPQRPEAPGQPGADIANRVQKLTLQALVYSEAARQRMVFINGRKYVEGDTVEGDLHLDRITEDGALLTYQGQRFVLRERSTR